MEPTTLESNELRSGVYRYYHPVLIAGWVESIETPSSVYLAPTKFDESISLGKKHWQEKDYDGDVWCPSVSTGLFIARRNGCVFVTGNSEMTLPPAKYGEAQRWVETYAGYSGESPLLEQLYEVGVKQGERFHFKGDMKDLELYHNDAARMLTLWNTHPRCPWQTDDYYAQESAVLAPNEFLRIHRNQWVSSTDVFIQPEWWYGCEGLVTPPDRKYPVVGSLDAGVSNDCFGILLAYRKKDLVYPFYAKPYFPPPGGKIDFSKPEGEIRRLAKQYNVIEWAYDEYQLHDMSKRLAREGVGWFRPFSQGIERSVADKGLLDAIRQRLIVNPSLPNLTDHLTNANAKLDGDRMRLVKRSETMKIDLAVCLSMANYELRRLNVG